MTRSEKLFKNTFILDCVNTELTASAVFTAMRFGFVDYEDLPLEVQKAVDEEIEKMKQLTNHVTNSAKSAT